MALGFGTWLWRCLPLQYPPSPLSPLPLPHFGILLRLSLDFSLAVVKLDKDTVSINRYFSLWTCRWCPVENSRQSGSPNAVVIVTRDWMLTRLLTTRISLSSHSPDGFRFLSFLLSFRSSLFLQPSSSPWTKVSSRVVILSASFIRGLYHHV